MATPSIPDPQQSPFDSIREIDHDLGEFWPGRQLQPLMGYDKWENFLRVIKRAIRAAENTGTYSEQSFSRTQENVPGGGPARIDYRFSREAAYLVAMNGDPNKAEVAAAQAYFVAKTREAERRFAIPDSFAGALELAARQARELESVRAEVAELDATNRKLSPKAARADQYEANPGITPTVFHKTWFPRLGEREFFEHLYRKDYLIDQRNLRWDERHEEWKDGPEHRHPTAKGKRYFYLQPTLDARGVRRQQTLVIPGDAEHDLVASLERDGLPSINRPAIPGAEVVHLVHRIRGNAS